MDIFITDRDGIQEKIEIVGLENATEEQRKIALESVEKDYGVKLYDCFD